jgi:predicted acylesterase/phospholipase RssA
LTPGRAGGTIGRLSTTEEGMPELRAEVENGPWPSDPEGECDLVMKGGVASGVVYPGAILALAKRYRFRNVGGTSAGAIAATVTAAAELGRREGAGGFERLRELADDIGTEKRVLGLFQPRPENRGFFDLVTRLMDAKAEGARARRLVVVDSLRQVWLPMILLSLAWLAAVSIAGYALFLWLGWWSVLAWLVLAAAAAVGVLVLVAAAVTVAFVRPGVALAKTLSSRETGFGLCPGTTQDGFDQPGLTDWLHTHIQACAGRPLDQPLTFADLADAKDDSRSISLQLMTTDVSSGRPVRLPLPDENDFYFNPKEIAQLVPQAVVQCMLDQSKATMTVGGQTVHQVPGAGMPVLLATRMSLAVPGLIASVPFYERRKEGSQPEHVEHWFSDGAITSNFPVHFFDALLPGRPTFGLDLMGAPDPALEAVIDNESEDETLHQVYLPAGPGAPEPLRWASINGFGGFIAQVLDTGLNWRDTLQMEMPGFRERVCHIRLDATEGGLNLSMKADAVQNLMRRGAYAGESFSRFSFPLHRFTRYLTLMQMLETELKRARERFGFDREGGDDPAWFRDRLLATVGDDDYPWETATDAAWCAQAREATQALLDVTAEWGVADPPALGFDRPGQTPTPRPALRVVPPV